jgi:hypothetical protein
MQGISTRSRRPIGAFISHHGRNLIERDTLTNLFGAEPYEPRPVNACLEG